MVREKEEAVVKVRGEREKQEIRKEKHLGSKEQIHVEEKKERREEKTSQGKRSTYRKKTREMS